MGKVMKDIKDRIKKKEAELKKHESFYIGSKKWYDKKFRLEHEIRSLKSQLQDHITTKDLQAIDQADEKS